MARHLDEAITIPLYRARSYPHTWPGDPAPTDAAIVDFDVDRMIVEVDVVEARRVTLAASTGNSGVDAYGQEYDLTPCGARALGRRLIAAAAECEQRNRDLATERD
jgi:hypothetical protein